MRELHAPAHWAKMVGASWLVAGCGGDVGISASELQLNLANDLVSIEKSKFGGSRPRPSRDVRGLPESSQDFYLAIRESLLDQRWFLSAYVKQFHPGGADVFSKGSLGTRVVSFKVQNDRLFVFDASDQFKSSEVEDPLILVEAYPIVQEPRFDALPGADRYILVDPAAGLNRFGVTGETYDDPYLGFGIPLRVGLSFMQNFRALSDGATFEQVFAGDLDLPGASPSVWGTLGISLRHYREGEGYVPTVDPGTRHFISGPSQLTPDSGGAERAIPLRWNFYPGMDPVQVSIGGGAFRAQADRPEADVLGALVRGVESWNDVFGFPVFQALLVDSDDVPDDDQMFMLVDYPGSGVGSAFANLHANPNTGEIRGGSVYFSGVFFDNYDSFADDPAAQAEAARAEASPATPVEVASMRSLVWGGIPGASALCNYPARPRASRAGGSERGPALTAAQKGDRLIEHVVAHEFGHMLGLMHNFKGSLEPPSSSIMDYTVDADSAAQPQPGAYDIAAIRYLYQLSTELPQQPFCTDFDLGSDPTCMQFDAGRRPLEEFWAPEYLLLADLFLQFGIEPELLELVGLNEILAYARDPGENGRLPPGDRAPALRVALLPARIPMSDEDASDPAVAAFANGVSSLVLRRAMLDAPESRGVFASDLTDVAVLELLARQSGSLVRNEDGVRPFELRRTAVDVLKRVQSQSALAELRKSKGVLEAALLASQVPLDEIPLTEDLLSRIEAALSPYFD
jgi:hypothetical protein